VGGRLGSLTVSLTVVWWSGRNHCAFLLGGGPERFAQQALGHNSRAVHHAYSRRAEVTVPSLDDWEKQWKERPAARGRRSDDSRLENGMAKPVVVQVDFKGQQDSPDAEGAEAVLAGTGRG
jgi:hypothetical protein